MTEETNKQYLGDGVYASYDGYQIILRVESRGQMDAGQNDLFSQREGMCRACTL